MWAPRELDCHDASLYGATPADLVNLKRKIMGSTRSDSLSGRDPGNLPAVWPKNYRAWKNPAKLARHRCAAVFKHGKASKGFCLAG